MIGGLITIGNERLYTITTLHIIIIIIIIIITTNCLVTQFSSTP